MLGEHGNCPACKADMNGGSIWQHFYDRHGSEAKADRIAAMYGATRSFGRWGRALAIYSRERDRTVAYRCPDCGHEWSADSTASSEAAAKPTAQSQTSPTVGQTSPGEA